MSEITQKYLRLKNNLRLVVNLVVVVCRFVLGFLFVVVLLMHSILLSRFIFYYKLLLQISSIYAHNRLVFECNLEVFILYYFYALYILTIEGEEEDEELFLIQSLKIRR